MTQQIIWQWLADALERQKRVVLMIVVSSKDSSPGKAGAKMAVTGNGESFGTIGGGTVEYDMLKQARALLESGSSLPLTSLRRQLLTNGAENSGGGCGGEQTVLMYGCRYDELDLFRRIADMAKNKAPGLLSLSSAGIHLEPYQTLPGLSQFSTNDDNAWLYRETLGVYPQAYLIGGGHVSLALSKVLAMLDFDITVIDERDSPDTMVRNSCAHHKWVIPYRDVDQVVPEGEQVFVLIMTHSHMIDEKVAELLAQKNVRYLGVLGSRNKIALLKDHLGARLAPQLVNRIHGPVGLPIHSRTPAEIAISIAAEWIQIINSYTEPDPV